MEEVTPVTMDNESRTGLARQQLATPIHIGGP
jgi:hypothetical protein